MFIHTRSGISSTSRSGPVTSSVFIRPDTDTADWISSCSRWSVMAREEIKSTIVSCSRIHAFNSL